MGLATDATAALTARFTVSVGFIVGMALRTVSFRAIEVMSADGLEIGCHSSFNQMSRIDASAMGTVDSFRTSRGFVATMV